jgi:acetyl esterase/lipase
MKKYLIILMVGCFLAMPSSSVQAQSSNDDKWVDYAAGEYDVLPNVTYSTRNKTELKLDVYLPRDRKSPVPAILLIHGGGWVAGQKEQNVMELLPYLSMGWVVLNVEYRLAENSLAPAAVEDCRCALRWVAYHAGNFNIDTSRIVVTGGSAGGHLALMTGMLPAQSKFDWGCGTQNATRWTNASEPSVHVAAIINWFGITDVADLLDGPDAKHYAVEWFGSMSNRSELAKELSPLSYIRPGLPPVITIQGDKDNIVPYQQGVRLHEALDKAGVPNQLVTIHGGGHGGFDREQLVSSFAAIRSFLKKHGILRN